MYFYQNQFQNAKSQFVSINSTFLGSVLDPYNFDTTCNGNFKCFSFKSKKLEFGKYLSDFFFHKTWLDFLKLKMNAKFHYFFRNKSKFKKNLVLGQYKIPMI